jgi:competence protein ComEC
LRLIVFDVGQGLAVAAQTHNHALLYDAGPDFSGEADSGNRILVPTLRALGVSDLDGMMLSHDDLDHIGGAASMLQAMPAGWLSSSLPDEHPLRRLLPRSPNPSDGTTSQSTKSASGQVAGYPVNGKWETKRCADGQGWEWDGVRFDVLHPDKTPGVYDKKQDNELSCVLRIGIGDQRILLVGDIEKSGERRLLKQHGDALHTTLLIAPHHGSKTSSSQDFVAATLPDHVVFTSGYRNRFGHPHADVLQRYADSGAQLLRSDMDGAILVEMDTYGLKLERYRQSHRRYWTHMLRQTE